MSNSKAIGVAYEDQKIVGGTVDNTPVGATTASTGAFSTLSATGAATLSGGATLSGTNTLSGATTITSAATLSGGATLSGTNTVSGATTVTSAATFDGRATFTATVTIGNSAADLVGFHGAAGSAQGTFVATQSINALTSGSVVGFTTSASLSSVVEKLNSVLALLIDKGLMAAS